MQGQVLFLGSLVLISGLNGIPVNHEIIDIHNLEEVLRIFANEPDNIYADGDSPSHFTQPVSLDSSHVVTGNTCNEIDYISCERKLSVSITHVNKRPITELRRENQKANKKRRIHAFEHITEGNQSQIAKPQFQLGCRYFTGDKVLQRNFLEATNLFQKAAEQSHDWANYYLGLCYEKGMGVCIDGKKAIDLYKKATNQGLSIAQSKVDVYEKSRETERNTKLCRNVQQNATQSKIGTSWYLQSVRNSMSENNEQSNGTTQIKKKKFWFYYSPSRWQSNDPRPTTRHEDSPMQNQFQFELPFHFPPRFPVTPLTVPNQLNLIQCQFPIKNSKYLLST